MEHEEVYALMMDALDGELAVDDREELEVHLRACPECRREWQALQAIEMLFRQSPTLMPAADFTQRTLARLPNHRYRVWAIGIIYVLLLVSGIIPLLLAVLAINRFGPALSDPALPQNAWAIVTQSAEIISAIISALLSGAGEVILQQPTIIGWLLVMIGIVSLWGGVYRQLVSQPQDVQR